MCTKVVNISFTIFSSIPRFKQRVEFLCVDYGNLYDLLDAVKVADSILLLLSTDNGIDEFGEYCLSCLLGQGLPAVTLALQVSDRRRWVLGDDKNIILDSSPLKHMLWVLILVL